MNYTLTLKDYQLDTLLYCLTRAQTELKDDFNGEDERELLKSIKKLDKKVEKQLNKQDLVRVKPNI